MDCTLFKAIQKDNYDTVKQLIQDNPGLMTQVKKYEFPVIGSYYGTAFHHCCADGELNVVKLYIENGFDVDFKADKDWTGLHFAAHQGQLEVIRYLISQGANPNAQNFSVYFCFIDGLLYIMLLIKVKQIVSSCL